MYPVHEIREDQEAFDRDLQRRGMSPMAELILGLDTERKQCVRALQENREQRNVMTERLKVLRESEPTLFSSKKTQLGVLKQQASLLEESVSAIVKQLSQELLKVPNRLSADVPDGESEHDNVLYRDYATTQKRLSQETHYEIGERNGWLDFKTAAKLSGSRFTILKGPLARLERALGQFMLDLHTREHGYEEISTPLLVHEQALLETGQLPKFANDLFRVGKDYWLIPTAEVTLTNMARGRIFDEAELPLRLTALTPCFRSEAGAAGKDTRGMLRQHQFYKVELVSIVAPEDSIAEHERMLSCAENVLKALDLSFRTMILCSKDTGFTSSKTYDIEVWLPGQNKYREISSCSNCLAFQARRMHAMVAQGSLKRRPVHTLNGSGVALGRCLIAIMENYYDGKSSIVVPKVLRPYMGGLERLEWDSESSTVC